MLDNATLNRQHRTLKSKLTRASNSHDPTKVLDACTDAVRTWETWPYWPDQWSRWQRALDDTFGPGQYTLEYL